MALAKRLKEATQAAHQAVESLPFQKALQERTLDPVSTRTLLRALAIVHAALERELRACGDERVRHLAHLAPFKSDLIRADLGKIGGDGDPDIHASILCALELAERVRERGSSDPTWLIGVLYTLEGSQNGGVFLRKMIRECPGQFDPISLGAYGENTGAHWKVFTAGLDSLELDENETGLAEAGALDAFRGFEGILMAVHPFRKSDLRYSVSALNPEAGDHAMPQTPEDIELARKAGERAWEKFPYLQARYADRGKRFTGSDSCWLMTLVPLPPPAIRKSLFWLRDLLSVRGIPGLILETHLAQILDLAQGSQPPRNEEFRNFETVFLELRNERRKRLADELLKKIAEDWEPALQASGGKPLLGASQVLASAWADEKNGVLGAFLSVQGWLMDPSRFSKEWVARIEALSAFLDQRS